jgi:hypothetical protein
VDPDVRSTLLGLGIAFCAIFGGITLFAAVDLGLNLRSGADLRGLVLYGISFGVIAMIGIGLYGALKNPPSRGERVPPVWPEDEEPDE